MTFATLTALLVPLAVATTISSAVPVVSSALLQGVVFEGTTNASWRPIICIQGMDCFELGDPVAHEFTGVLLLNETQTSAPLDSGSTAAAGVVRPADAEADVGDILTRRHLGFCVLGTCCTRCYENGVRLFSRRRLDEATTGTRVQCAPREYGLECSPL